MRIIHGASTVAHVTTVTSRWRIRTRRVNDLVNMIHGNASSGSSKMPSPRARAARAIVAPNKAAVVKCGRSRQRYARIMVIVTSNAIRPSGYSKLSISHRFG